MITNSTPEQTDPLDDLLKEIDGTKLYHCDHWPQIKITGDMKIIGQGTERMKRICKAIRINESAINDMTKRLQKLPSKSDERDEFYNEFILPLEERGFRLLSLLELTIQMEFPIELMEDNEDAILGIGTKGKVFCLKMSASKLYGIGGNRLYHKSTIMSGHERLIKDIIK